MTSDVAEARIRTAGPDDALVVAALTLQCALDRGGNGEPGFLDRFADAWTAQRHTHPVWIAEVGDQHAGFLQAVVLSPLPWPGRSAPGGELVVQTLFLRPEHRGHGVGELLLRAAIEQARRDQRSTVSIASRAMTRPMLERVGFVRDENWFRVTL